MFPPPGIARQDWKIVRALAEFVGVTLPYSSEEEMEERVNTLVPLTLNMDEVSPSEVCACHTHDYQDNDDTDYDGFEGDGG